MPTRRSRSHRKNAKRHHRKNSLLGLLLIIFFIILATGFYLNRHRFFQSEKMLSPSSSQATATTQTAPSSTEEDKKETEERITWEKQSSPVNIPILMYHAVHVMAPEEAANANLIIDPTTFENHLKAFQEAGYYTITPEEAYKILSENVLPKDKKVVWLTFDDSLWDFYSIAYPLLKQYNMKATNNVITGATDTQSDHLTLEQIKEMKTNGISFQSHTVTHPDLEFSSLESQNTELKESKSYLDSTLHQDTIAVAYPAGRYSDQTIRTVEEAQYKLGVTTNEGLASAANGLLTLNRIRILPVTTPEVLLQTIRH